MDDNTQQVMFGHKSDDWTTPRVFFDELDKEFQFDIDGAATKQNALCSRYYGIDNGAGICASLTKNGPQPRGPFPFSANIPNPRLNFLRWDH